MNSQVLKPSPPIELNFHSTPTSPYATAPSSPKIFFPNLFYSAATDDFQSGDAFVSCDESGKQEKEDHEEDTTDFAFDFSGQLEPPSISDAEELFHGGKIKPLEAPPPPRSPPGVYSKKYKDQTKNPFPLGRETTPTATSKHKKSQSLSPMRVSDILAEHEKVSTNQSFPFNFMWYNKWNLKNLLLFRSTSEGSAATTDDLLKKYEIITKGEQDTKSSSFRSCDGGGSVDGSSRRRMKRKVSAHEIHYTANRAVAEGMKKKTYLPYRSGLLGCLGFSHNLHDMSRRR